MIAYCYADGGVSFGDKLPARALPIASSPLNVTGAELQAWEDTVRGFCRRSYGGSPLVPGIPEAADESAALEALDRFSKVLEGVFERQRARKAANP